MTVADVVDGFPARPQLKSEFKRSLFCSVEPTEPALCLYKSNACKYVCIDACFFFLIGAPFRVKEYYAEFPPLPKRSVTKGFVSHVMFFCDTRLLL